MTPIKVQPLTKNIGAEVTGLDLKVPLSAKAVEQIDQALLDHHVLFFPGQDISPEEQVSFARHFGPINVPAFSCKYTTSPEYVVLDQDTPKGEGADQWHTDSTFMPNPPMGSVLKAVILPSLGGDTCFASMFAAYDALSEPMKKMLEGLWATHDISNTLERGIQSGNVDVDAQEMKENWPPVKHPVIQKHPRTGRKALFVHRNATVRIDGLTDRENEVLLPLLCDHIRDPLYQCRHRWDTRTVVFWDNRAAQHYAVPDYDERRVMHRVTVDDYRAI